MLHKQIAVQTRIVELAILCAVSMTTSVRADWEIEAASQLLVRGLVTHFPPELNALYSTKIMVWGEGEAKVRPHLYVRRM